MATTTPGLYAAHIRILAEEARARGLNVTEEMAREAIDRQLYGEPRFDPKNPEDAEPGDWEQS